MNYSMQIEKIKSLIYKDDISLSINELDLLRKSLLLQLNDNRLERVFKLKSEGMSNVAIAKQYGVSEGAVRKWIKKGASYNSCKESKTYIIKDLNTNLYKIGRSKNPKVREKTLQSEKPTYKIVKVFDEDIEGLLHNNYAQFRVRGEWFDLSKVQITYICKHY